MLRCREMLVGMVVGLLVVTVAGTAFARPQADPTQDRQETLAGTSRQQPQVVGQLGLVHTAQAPIRKTPTPQGKVVTRANNGAYLALGGAKGDYYRVLLADRSYGYISRKDIEILKYEVISSPLDDKTPYRMYGFERGTEDAKKGRKDLRAVFKRNPSSATAYLPPDSTPHRVKGQSAEDLALRLAGAHKKPRTAERDAFIEGYAAGFAEASAKGEGKEGKRERGKER